MLLPGHERRKAVAGTKQNTYFVGLKARMRSLAEHSRCFFFEDNERNKMTEVLLRCGGETGQGWSGLVSKSWGKGWAGGPAFLPYIKYKIPLKPAAVNPG